MKYILVTAAFVVAGLGAEAQGGGGVTGAGQSGGSTSGRPSTSAKGATPKVAKHHGPKDVTPGSPIGTGGAGDNMSGSRSNSALESSLKKQKDGSNNQQKQVSGQARTKSSNTTTGRKTQGAKKPQ